ncbi:uncharacterized protein LOC124255317 [Haliotis rubra]|uniref:uncharacterized protein LOC124255317 n=1 Tax=Haliotis rubra TaxID=36100 RepID=UPI001EE54A1E|nr:uncharacterized protein LOC124255317 [Haliotis rubra]XP_046545160.1 uncharacterized protein LOC124255317 [Haliotis rubra]
MSPVPDEDPDKQDFEDIEDMDTPNLVIPAVIENSEDEDEDTVPQGYQPLSQGPEDMNGNNFDEDSDDDSGMSEGEETGGQNVAMASGIVPSGLYPNFPDGDLPSYLQVPDLPRPDKREMLWNQPRHTSADGMDSGQAAAVKNAMKGFELPGCSIPDWAKNVSEDKWKEQLLSRLSTGGPRDNIFSASLASSSEMSSQSSESSLSEAEKEIG